MNHKNAKKKVKSLIYMRAEEAMRPPWETSMYCIRSATLSPSGKITPSSPPRTGALLNEPRGA